MAHIITSLCMRDGACIEVCPVECIVAGKPESEWPWVYIDGETCIDCGACETECQYGAIFPEDEVPEAYTMKPDQRRVPHDTRTPVVAAGGEVVNLRDDIPYNAKFFKEGPGYKAREM